MTTAVDAFAFSNIAATTSPFRLKGGYYMVAAVGTDAFEADHGRHDCRKPAARSVPVYADFGFCGLLLCGGSADGMIGHRNSESCPHSRR
jgi:hypothetical protein